MIPKFIDAHVHLNTLSKEKMEMAVKHDVSFLSINTNIPFFESIEDQEAVILKLQEQYPGRVQYATSFNFSNWGKEGFAKGSIEQIKRGLENGAVAVKIWKDLGFDYKDENGKWVMIDNPIFDPIFEYLVENDILLIGHQGEPRNCWLPLEEMTVDSDRDYFAGHPEYHMYLHKEFPSYEDQMQARDNMMRKFPKMRYVGMHLFSMEWSIEEVAKRLDEFPGNHTDLAERVCHLQLQAQDNWQAVRDFCIKYQDRIMYGTDVIDDGSLSGHEYAERFEHLWKFHYQFFATNDLMQAPEFKGDYRGLDLPSEVVEKIFYTNAKKLYQFK